MTTAQARLPGPTSLSRHIQTGLIFGLLLAAAVCWAVTDQRMDGMDAGPGTDPGDLGFWLTVWVVMMAAMMFPSVAPAVTAFAAMGAGERPDQARVGTVPMFIAGYLLTWTAVGLVGYAVIEAGRDLSIDFLAWNRAGRYVAGGVILGAAVYQLTAPKDACLRHCRSPRTFLVEHWRPGRIGALRMGLEHGGFCVGCCWALMAALFALGVMSIGWMAFVAALIATEKLLPWKALANRGIAILLALLAIALAFAPDHVPGLTIPGSPEAAQAMEAMGMEPEGGGMGMESEDGEMRNESVAPGGGSMRN
jgi:predicted metal-binding membrane protein